MINLLPPKYKTELDREENWRMIVILGFLFLAFLSSLILILFSIKTYTQSQVESLKVLIDLEGKTFQTSEIQLLREKITAANKNLSKLGAFYRNQVNSTAILEKVSQAIPSEIYLTGFSWDKKTSQIALSGFSPGREILLSFKKRLEEKKEFTDIHFPPSNWLEPENINFQTTFKLNQEK